MLSSLEEHFGGRATWTKPQGGLFIWATLDGGVDTTDLLAHAEGVAFVPGRAAYMDGRGASSMRLNFAGSPDEDIREGITRIGRTMGGQAGLIGVLTGSSPARSSAGKDAGETTAEQAADEVSAPGMADVVELPRRGGQGPADRRSAGERQDR